MGIFYDAVILTFAVFSLPKFAIRLSQAVNPKRLVRERLSGRISFSVPSGEGKKIVWVHAVSVGEVNALRSWIPEFYDEHPDWFIALSVSTPTGYDVAAKQFGGTCFVFYAPVDLSWTVRRVLNRLNPKWLILVELELWPNLIREAFRRGVSIGVINGRMSPHAFKRYRAVKPLMAPFFQKLKFCLVQTERDHLFFSEMGVRGDACFVMGNLKFDQVTETLPPAAISFFDVHPRSGYQLVMGGSTSGDEEETLIDLYKRLQPMKPSLRLVLAPRHPEHIGSVRRSIQNAGFSCGLFSEGWNFSDEKQIQLVDQMGVLSWMYALADIVFIGGSLIQKGGQNPIEAAVYKKAILHGPHVFNFSEIYKRFDQTGGSLLVSDREDLFKKIQLLINDHERCLQMGRSAYKTVQSFKGAQRESLRRISRYLDAYANQSEMVSA